MNHLENLPANLGYLLLVAVALWVLYKLAVHTGESSPLLEDEPAPFTPDTVHIKEVLADLGLRKALPVYAKRDAGTSEAEARDIADLKRGTSDMLARLLP